jgi:septal ring factor EnvC (AmiA/AmiB activator)
MSDLEEATGYEFLIEQEDDDDLEDDMKQRLSKIEAIVGAFMQAQKEKMDSFMEISKERHERNQSLLLEVKTALNTLEIYVKSRERECINHTAKTTEVEKRIDKLEKEGDGLKKWVGGIIASLIVSGIIGAVILVRELYVHLAGKI